MVAGTFDGIDFDGRQAVLFDRDSAWDVERGRKTNRWIFKARVLVQRVGQTIELDPVPRQSSVQLWVHSACCFADLLVPAEILCQCDDPQWLEPFDDHGFVPHL